MEEIRTLNTLRHINVMSHVASVFTQPGHVFSVLYWLNVVLFCTKNGGILTEVWVENGVIDLSITKSLPYTFNVHSVFVRALADIL